MPSIWKERCINYSVVFVAVQIHWYIRVLGYSNQTLEVGTSMAVNSDKYHAQVSTSTTSVSMRPLFAQFAFLFYFTLVTGVLGFNSSLLPSQVVCTGAITLYTPAP